ncbi:urea ABC transporter ATP-binding subunit UrtE [Synechococcus sp. PCC 7336]|uniref:urea ABC transporter ATP-binding subunit UrtE n=1 Tax=Synechococcus sp. PCC 7336 TaxID=195250 RepID=UPI00056EF62B|nr:urea ABC transporter ATP-binding subunit UrtE [Synechococcus sp. PCC 7336]
MKPLLEVSNFNVYYGESHIIRDLSLKVLPGQAVCLLGRNGMGKTTTLKTIMGLLAQRSGTLTLDGDSISHARPYQRACAGIGYVPQGREIFPRLSVEENLLVGLEASAENVKSIPEFVYDLFPILKDFLKRYGGDLSGGQQQQLAIARALVSNPKVLVLDEPTEGIQPSIIIEIEEAISKIKQERGIAVLLVEQYFQFAQSLADYYYLIENGSLVTEGLTSEMDVAHVQSYLSV